MQCRFAAKDKEEAVAIRLALEDEAVRAFVVIIGHLKKLDSDRDRERVLNFVIDAFDDEEPGFRLRIRRIA